MPLYDTVNFVSETALYVPTTGWTALRVGSSEQVSRKYLSVFNRSPYKLFITTNSSADVRHTRAIRQGGERIFPYSDRITLYGRSGGARGARIIVAEESG